MSGQKLEPCPFCGGEATSVLTINANASGKSGNITYDPHDAEAVKAAEAWRKALFSAARWTYEEPIAVCPGDTVTFTGQRCRDYQPTLDALKKAVKPLRDYLRAHGDPHTSVIVTQYGATKTQDEPAAQGAKCLDCYLRQKRYDRAKWTRTDREEWKAAERCYFCGAERLPGQKVCRRHYRILTANITIRQQANRERRGAYA